MNTRANDRAAGRETGEKVAQILFRDLGLDTDDPSIVDRALNIRATIYGDERFPFESNPTHAENLYYAWDDGFWETFEAARRQIVNERA
jgi:hypothetical protein